VPRATSIPVARVSSPKDWKPLYQPPILAALKEGRIKRGPHQEHPMQTRNPFIDDLAKMASGAMGALTGVKDEVENRVRDQIAKILDGMDIPRRDEFDAVKAMAVKAREENEELKKQIADLQARLLNTGP
jgi:BMFP domain-containing protein YqiC